MTPEQKQIVKETWQHVAPIGHVVSDQFYRRLFDIDGSTRRLFRNTDMPEQQRKLVQALVWRFKAWTGSKHFCP